MTRSRFVHAVLSVVLITVVTACSGGGPAPSSSPATTEPPDFPTEVSLTEADDGAAVRLASGGTLVITLESNPSTGFTWAIAGEPPAQVALQGEPDYVEPDQSGDVVGAPGSQVFTFVAVAPGSGTLHLAYARTWEEGTSPEASFAVSVEVG